MSKSLYFEILSGDVLTWVKAHIAARKASDARNRVLLDELGVERFWPSILDGTVSAVSFGRQPHHPDFTKPDRKGVSRPKKGTEWRERFAAQVGYDRRGYDLADALGIPTSISYADGDGKGCSVLGGFSSGVGFLYCSEDGPYALYTPDVAARVAEYEAKGYTVDEACKTFKPVIPGCRHILEQEWDFIVAKFEMEEARAARKEAA